MIFFRSPATVLEGKAALGPGILRRGPSAGRRWALPGLLHAGLMAIFAVLGATVFAKSTAADEPLRVGVAAVDITPPVGWRMSGYFSERFNTGTHDPLWAKAMVFVQGDVRAALICCDLIGPTPLVVEPARARIEAELGIPAERTIVHGTHTHTGPLYFGTMRDYFHARTVAREGSDAAEPIDYRAALVEKLVEATAAALKDALADGPAPIFEAGIGEETSLSFNRRWHMRDGSVVTNPGHGNPKLIRPAGPIDPDVGVLLFRNAESGAPRAALTVFALHLDTVGGTLYAADYPYYLQEGLKERYGAGFFSAFANGCCGDINHIDYHRPTPRKIDREAGDKIESDRIGTVLAARVAETLPLLRPQTRPMLASRRAVVAAEKQRYSPEQTERAERDLEKIGTAAIPMLEQVEAVKIADLGRRKGDTIALETIALRLSDETVVVSLPGEVFVEHGLTIKRLSPFRHTLVVELCHDTPAYIPTRRAFVEGSYETINSRTVPGSGERLVEAAVKLLEELKP